MRAIYYEDHGDASVFKKEEIARPSCGKDQVLIEVAAAGVNPINWRLRSGELQDYITRTFPVVPGLEVAGRIAEVGDEVSDWRFGDGVMKLAFTWSIQHGTYAGHVPIDATGVARKPSNARFAEAANSPLVSLTAWQSLCEFGFLQPTQSVLLQAEAGGVGSVAIPMAKHLGATVYTTSSRANSDYVRVLVADVVIDYQDQSYEETVFSAQPDGLDLILESLWGETIAKSAIRIAKDGGVIAYIKTSHPTW